MKVKEIPIDDIIVPAEQVRSWATDEGLDELAKSIKEVGLLQPILLAKDKDRYRLVAGWRRLHAVKKLRWAAIPSVLQDMNEEQQAWAQLTENLSREDVDPLSEARFIYRLSKLDGVTQEKIGLKLGKSRPWVSQRLKLIRLDDHLQQLIQDKLLKPELALELGKISDLPMQRYYADQAVANGSSLRTLRTWVTNLQVEMARDEATPDPIPIERLERTSPPIKDKCLVCQEEDGKVTVIWRPICLDCRRVIEGQGVGE